MQESTPRRGGPKTHGKRYIPEYRVWQAMIQRCINPNDSAWHNYGGRGITVCKRWRHDFEAFIVDMGHRPTPLHSLDRVDNSDGYAPGNCRWATRSEQALNRRTTHMVEYGGEVLPLSIWAQRMGLTITGLRRRIERDGVAAAMEKPVRTSVRG